MPRVGKKHFPYTPAGVKAAGKLKQKISSRAASVSTKPAAIKAPGKGPSPRAMERANANASFKRAASPSAKAPGQMKKAAGAQSAKAFAPGQMKKVAPAAIKAPRLASPGPILQGGLERMPRVR